jgi:glycosyltransferase involved in cell wall biosynthesis
LESVVPRVLFFTQKVDESDSVLGFVCDWIAALGRRVERLHCVCLEAGAQPSFPGSVVVHSLGRESGHGRARLVWESQKLVRHLVSSGEVDAVLAHMAPLFTVLTYPWAAPRSLPILTWYTHRQVTSALRLAVAMSDRVLTAAPHSISIESDKVVATGHGIRVPVAADLRFEETDEREVLAVGRLTPIKRWETFIEAAALLKDRGYRFRLVGDAALEGDIPYREKLRALAAALGLSSVVSFEGAVAYREMPAYYRRAFCSVNACVESSFDKAVLESMAYGKPALVSNPTFAPLLAAEAPALLFSEGDAEALASRIEALRTMPAGERRALGLRLREKVEREHGLDRLMDLIVELLETAAARRHAVDAA